MLWRMNGIPSPLAGKISNEEVYIWFWPALITVQTQQKISRAKDFQCILRDWHIPANPGAELSRKSRQAEARRNDFVSRSSL